MISAIVVGDSSDERFGGPALKDSTNFRRRRTAYHLLAGGHAYLTSQPDRGALPAGSLRSERPCPR